MRNGLILDIMKVEVIGSFNVLGIGCERNREVKDNFSSLNNWKDGVVINWEENVSLGSSGYVSFGVGRLGI